MISTHSALTNDFQEAIDWTYSMRREMQEIVKGLFLGPYSVAVRSKVLVFFHSIPFKGYNVLKSDSVHICKHTELPILFVFAKRLNLT